VRAYQGGDTSLSRASGGQWQAILFIEQHDGKPPGLSLATSLPLSVWQDHLVPVLRRSEAARLRGVCKALRGVVGECPVELGRVMLYELEAALTCFPAAQSLLMVEDTSSVLSRSTYSAGMWREVWLLRKYGGSLKRVKTLWQGADELLLSAVQAGALPKLASFNLTLSDLRHRQLLSDGRLEQLLEIRVWASDVRRRDAEEPHLYPMGVRGEPGRLAALEHLRRLPQLQRLALLGNRHPGDVAFPPVIPPSLKALTLSGLESLVRDLPSMLQTSGATLEEIELQDLNNLSAEGCAAIARALRTCSPTLRDVRIFTGSLGYLFHSHEVIPGLMSCCEGLERLRVPWGVFRRLPPTCPTSPSTRRMGHLTWQRQCGA
jgi:hypothetical protein